MKLKSKIKIIFTLFILTANAFAQVKLSTDTVEITPGSHELRELLQSYYSQLNVNLIIPQSMASEEVKLLGTGKMSKGQFDRLLSALLDQHGLARLLQHANNTVEILQAKDIRSEPVQLLKSISEVPRNYDLYQTIIELKHIPGEMISRGLRPISSRVGRLTPVGENKILIQDTGLNIHRAHKIIQFLDDPETALALEKAKEFNLKLEKLKLTSSNEFKTSLFEAPGLVMAIVLLLLGGVVGFGARGYLIRRIEGGW